MARMSPSKSWMSAVSASRKVDEDRHRQSVATRQERPFPQAESPTRQGPGHSPSRGTGRRPHGAASRHTVGQARGRTDPGRKDRRRALEVSGFLPPGGPLESRGSPPVQVRQHARRAGRERSGAKSATKTPWLSGFVAFYKVGTAGVSLRVEGSPRPCSRARVTPRIRYSRTA